MLWKVERYRQLYLESQVYLVQTEDLTKLVTELMNEEGVTYINMQPTDMKYAHYTKELE